MFPDKNGAPLHRISDHNKISMALSEKQFVDILAFFQLSIFLCDVLLTLTFAQREISAAMAFGSKVFDITPLHIAC